MIRDCGFLGISGSHTFGHTARLQRKNVGKVSWSFIFIQFYFQHSMGAHASSSFAGDQRSVSVKKSSPRVGQ